MDVSLRSCLYFCIAIINSGPILGSIIEGRLIEHVLTNYSPSIRPVLNHSTVLNLTFNMRMWQVLAVDEKHQKVTVQNYFQIKWVNELLTWDPMNWGGIRGLMIPPEKVWTPDIVLLNSGDGEGSTIQQHTDVVLLHYNGSNTWFPKVKMTASFSADTKYFPFDSQNLSFRFESWSLPERKLRMIVDDHPMIDEHYENSSEWRLAGMDKRVTSLDYNGDIYSDVLFTFVFSRKPSYFVTTLILPCVILLSIVLFSYFLPASSGERMAVIVTALLGFAVFLEVVANSLPQNSNSTSILSVYILATMFECTLSFLATCFVLQLLHKKTNMKDLKCPPQFLRRSLKLATKQESTSQQWRPEKVVFNEKGELVVLENFRRMSIDSAVLQKQTNMFDSIQLDHMQNISKSLREITSSLKAQKDEEKIHVEWVRLANSIDRISFWVFLIVAILSIGILFIGYARYY